MNAGLILTWAALKTGDRVSVVIGHGLCLFVEVKTPKGKMRLSQQVFRAECEENDVSWELWRDVRDAWDWAVNHGIVEEA